MEVVSVEVIRPANAPKPHVFVVMPTTHRRRWCLPRAIKCWQAQQYQNMTLLVVGGGHGVVPGEGVEDLVPTDDPRIKYAFAPPMSLGAKFNWGIEQAPEDSYIMIAGDDDWVSPELVQYLVDVLNEMDTEIAGTLSMLSYRMRDKSMWVYANRVPLEATGEEDDDTVVVTEPYLIGGTMIFHKRHWREVPFPDVQAASDSAFIHALLARDGVKYVPVNEPALYCAFTHGENTGNILDQLGQNSTWARLGEVDAAKLPKMHGCMRDALDLVAQDLVVRDLVGEPFVEYLRSLMGAETAREFGLGDPVTVTAEP